MITATSGSGLKEPWLLTVNIDAYETCALNKQFPSYFSPYSLCATHSIFITGWDGLQHSPLPVAVSGFEAHPDHIQFLVVRSKLGVMQTSSDEDNA